MSSDYRAKAVCRNCKESSWHDIPKGLTIKEFLTEKKCLNCGCVFFYKKEEKDKVKKK